MRLEKEGGALKEENDFICKINSIYVIYNMDTYTYTDTYSYTVTYNNTDKYSVQEVKVYNTFNDSYKVTYNVSDYNNNTLVATLTDVLRFPSGGYTIEGDGENYNTGAVSSVKVRAATINGVYIVTIDTDKSKYVVTSVSYTYNPSDSSYTDTYSVTETNPNATYTITVTGIQGDPDSPITYTISDSVGVVRTVTDTRSQNAECYNINSTFVDNNNTLTISENVD